MSVPSSINNAIVAQWNSTAGLGLDLEYGGIPLFQLRAPEGTKNPYAIFNDILPDPSDAFSTDLQVDKLLYQFSVFDTDGENVSNVLDLIKLAYHRQQLSILGTTFLSGQRKGSGILVEPKEDAKSLTLFHGWTRFKFTVDW